MQDERPDKTRDKKFAPLNRDSKIDETAKNKLKMFTQDENAQILGKLRGIVKEQLKHLEKQALKATFSSGEAAVLYKMAQTYDLLDKKTDKEQAKYDFGELGQDELESLALTAQRLLAK